MSSPPPHKSSLPSDGSTTDEIECAPTSRSRAPTHEAPRPVGPTKAAIGSPRWRVEYHTKDVPSKSESATAPLTRQNVAKGPRPSLGSKLGPTGTLLVDDFDLAPNSQSSLNIPGTPAGTQTPMLALTQQTHLHRDAPSTLSTGCRGHEAIQPNSLAESHSARQSRVEGSSGIKTEATFKIGPEDDTRERLGIKGPPSSSNEYVTALQFHRRHRYSLT